ncbi:hypothetical protein D9756_003986 [Leucocoprinus leucothites]|uniref:Autophagy-related protein 14 n=1 Tax=Leucocoprinus leucothites TaxID=201217 RepID=A0A8H5D9L6_9AGAR|nr:hypothetical protein D9756_003986 [Leucoagaricus leucothites]
MLDMGRDTSPSVNNAAEDIVEGVLLPRRIRHTTCIQVCNFTPFPVRDHVTTALSQPVEPSQLNSLGHLSDDLDVSSRIRPRKISTTSSKTKSSGRLEDEDFATLPEPRGRKVSGRGLNGNLGLDNSPPGVPRIPYGSPQNIRRRGRTNSVTSSMSSQHKAPNLLAHGVSASMTASSLSAILPDISQQGLESVIDSRLIETFLTIFALPNQTPSPPKAPSSSGHIGRGSASGRRTHPASVSCIPAGFKDKVNSGTMKSLPSKLKASHSRSSSYPVSHASEDEAQASSLQSNGNPSSPSSPVPDFFSQIHRPSVNPTFPIDARPGHDFSSESDTSGSRMKVQLWGRTKGLSTKAAGKQRQRSSRELVVESDAGWNIMEEWEFSLDDLRPASENVVPHTSDLPPNTLLVTLKPPGKAYYLPLSHAPLPRSPSPGLGYSSDPEFAFKRSKPEDHISEATASSEEHTLDGTRSARVRLHKGNDDKNTPPKGLARTATYQQLFEFVNLQALILEHENNLSDLVGKIDKQLKDDPVFPLRREMSERGLRLITLQNDFKLLVEGTATKKNELEMRRQRLKERRQSLVSARILEEANISDVNDLVQEVELEREQLKELHAKFPTLRIGLLSTLASIYPIELDSPPDLLYTILDVPLPIPLTATDPAPPLSLPNHRNVNEDSVATALGYVAQLLQFLAAYLGKTLIYPVTCVGSRSFIKDGISAMVGPRMFPLFPKGVDTYRFEYGVFLLNKDIEMLMIDRDLRALDLRHTLPNLKNLVLTVTHGEVTPVKRKVPPDSPALSMLGLDSPTQEEPSTEIGSVTPKAKKLNLEIPPEEGDHTPPEAPASGSTTPTAATLDEKKSRPFLGLSFPDFLRGRYPSTGRASVKGTPGNSGSQIHVSGSNESTGSDAPEAYSDRVEIDVKTSLEELEVPNRRQPHEGGSEHAEETVEHKLEETVPGSDSASVHVH